MTLSAFLAALAGLFTAIAALITAIKGHTKTNAVSKEVTAVAEELHNGNGNGHTTQ